MLHRDSDQSCAHAAGVRLEQNRVMYPMVLQVLHLRAFSHGDADAVIAHRKYRHAELEQGLKLFSRFHAYRTADVGEIAVIAEQRLPKPILDIESDDGTGDVGMSLTTDAERNVFAAHAPAEASA